MFANRFNGLLLVIFLMVGVSGCGDSMPQRPEADDGSSVLSESPIRNVVLQDAVLEPDADGQGGLQGTLQSLWGREDPNPGIGDGKETMKWANETFELLKAKGLTTANDATSWVTEDFKNINAWEYKVKTTGPGEDLEKALNEMGTNRWECFQIIPGRGNGFKLVFKKRKQSYLKSLPTADLMRLVPMMRSE